MTDTDQGIAAERKPFKTGKKPARHVPELAVHNFRTGARAHEGATSGDVTNGLTDIGMLGNAEEGDCVPAATEHFRMTKGLYSGDTAPTEVETLKLYHDYGAAQGQGPDSDEGVEIASWLQWLFEVTQAAKEAGDDIEEIAYVEITDLDPDNLGVEMLEFRGLILGVDLTDDAQQLFPNSPWTVANGETPDPQEGHGILHAKFDKATQMAEEGTWAQFQQATYDWLRACVTEAWAIMTREDAENSNVDFDACVAAIKAAGGQVSPNLPEPLSPSPAPPAPSPSPSLPPSPSPEPDPSPTPSGPPPGQLKRLEQDLENALVVLQEACGILPEPAEKIAVSALKMIERWLQAEIGTE